MAKIAAIRVKLLQERERLSRAYDFCMSNMDFQELATETLRQALQEKLGDLEQALYKLDQGSYGLCNTCGGDISDERLHTLPSAGQCFDCSGDDTGHAEWRTLLSGEESPRIIVLL